MSKIRVTAQALVGATPQQAYAIIADYHTHHPQIVPPKYFRAVTVLEGGIGAGTLVRADMNAFGRAYHYLLRVTEPEPGRVLAETDQATGMATTFTVEPGPTPAQAQVTIATEWEPKGGLAGWLDRRFTPPVMRRIYQEELARLDQYARTLPAPA